MSWREVGLRRMLTDWVFDPVRRWHVIVRVLETGVPVFALLAFIRHMSWALTWLGVWLGTGFVVLAEWLLYEFVLEPYLGAGPYWERGPRDGETFTRW